LVWRLDTGRLVRDLSPDVSVVEALAFSLDSKFLACSGYGVALFDTTRFQRDLHMCSDPASSIAFVPDSHLLAIAGSCLGRVRLWDYVINRDGAELQHVSAPRDFSHFSVLSSGDPKILVAASRRIVRTWNLAGSGEKLTLAGHGKVIVHLAFSPDGKLLASAGSDDALKIWDPTTGQLLQKLTDFRDGVQASAFSADGRTLAASDGDGAIQIWDAESWHKLAAPTDAKLAHQQILSAAFSPNGHYFAVCEGFEGRGITLWGIKPDSAKEEASGLRMQPIVRPVDRGNVGALLSAPIVNCWPG
jgi:WD40 repeat protein